MFDTLSDRLDGVFARLRGRGRLSEAQVDETMREIRLALLEADVHTSVVREFMSHVRERAVGDEVRKALTPVQSILKIVNDEMIAILGAEHAPLTTSPKPPTVIMMAGLQGSGKTTAAAKLARLLAQRGRKPLLVACDLRRPAAIEQLQILGKEIDVPVVARQGEADAVALAADGVREAVRLGRDHVIVDTAGRLHIDEEMMNEAAAIKERIQPSEVLFVADAMTGQDAVNVATTFLERVDFTGVVLSKLDGDARGGAALSVAHVCKRPIKFASTGERLDAFEPFHPDRMASRILGMGDMLTLIEKAEEAFEDEQQEELEEKMRTATFGLDDFLDQMKGIRKMGSLSSMLGMIPGIGKQLKSIELDDNDLVRVEAIIHSMTPQERREPNLINNSRKQRIARGCGRQLSDVTALLKQFEQARIMMKAVASGAATLPGMPHQPALAGGMPGGAPHRQGPKKQRPHRPKQHGKNKKRKRK